MATEINLLLCDIDGTLTTINASGAWAALPGVQEALKEIRRRIKTVFVTNTTSQSQRKLHRLMIDLGLQCELNEIYTPWALARRIMTERNRTQGYAFLPPHPHEDADWFEHDPTNGNAVLIADESLDTTFREVQEAFRLLMRGAELYTLQRNRFYKGPDGLRLDLGPLTAALEYASGKSATVFGKPSKTLFARIAEDFGTDMAHCAIVGDDAEFDVAAAMRLGLKGILVKTGKYMPGVEETIDCPPSLVLNSFTELPEELSRL